MLEKKRETKKGIGTFHSHPKTALSDYTCFRDLHNRQVAHYEDMRIRGLPAGNLLLLFPVFPLEFVKGQPVSPATFTHFRRRVLSKRTQFS